PINDARIRIQGAQDFVLSNKNGLFMISLNTPNRKVSRQYIVVAGKESFFNGSQVYRRGSSDLTIKLQRVPNRDFKDYSFIITSPLHASFSPNDQINCANCHTTHLWEWGASKMGKAGTNKEVMKEYKVFKSKRKPYQENTCADCHAPIAAFNNPGKTDFNQAVRDNSNRSKGIECDFCHKIKAVEVGNKPGVQAIDLSRQHFGQGMMQWIMAYGPYDNVQAMPMAASYHPLYKKSAYCSSCHQDAWKLPGVEKWDYLSVYPEAAKQDLYEKGRVIPNQWTYQEWSEWQATLNDDHQNKGTTCQNCHMNWSQDMMPYYRYIVSGEIRDRFGNERAPDSITPHRFQGATTKMLTGVANLVIVAEADKDKLLVNIKVTNVNAGHRLPTGESSRNLILLVEAKDGKNRLLKLISGSHVPEWGGVGNKKTDYAQHPGKGFARIMIDKNGKTNVSSWEAVAVVSDNRLKPKTVDQSDFLFFLPNNIDREEVSVTAKLIYRKKFKTALIKDETSLKEMVIEEKTIDLDTGGL
ncbi:MAG: hypothetical protein HOD92_10665, partial [Deltaproteobacteria bacterium]|nr:hypothetical protein [Deltaproteobacteria bacterium]